MASVTEAGLITADEFAELFGPDDRVELVHGKIVNRMAPDPFHGNMVGLLCQMFNPYFSQEKGRFSHLTLCFKRTFVWPESCICSH